MQHKPSPPSTVQPARIDVHQHILPPAYRDFLQSAGIHQLAGQPLPEWSVEQALALMDAQGIATAITSVPASDLPFADARSAAELARACNAWAAQLLREHPGRFGAFALVPQQFVPEAIGEVAHALDVLGLDGVLLSASCAGKFLGDAQFEALLAELDRRQATVFVHPGVHASSAELALDTPAFLVEMPCDVTRAAVNLIVTGSMERYPRIRWILGNAGGFLPYVAWRVSLANALPEFSARAPQGILHYLRQFHFDTAQTASRIPLAALRELVGPRQVLFGTDYPLAAAESVEQQCRFIAATDLWPAAERSAIQRGNALSLFPRFAAAGEVVVPAPVQRSQPPLARLRRRLAAPLQKLAASLRK